MADTTNSDCIFCKIARGEIKAEKLWDDEYCFAIADMRPQAPKHLLVIPKEHVANITLVEDPTLLGRLFQSASQLAKKTGLADGFRLVVNTGNDGGQTVYHLHIHVLGGRFMTWPPG